MLDERKKQILRAIVDSYISTAEPVGSRTLEKKYNLGLSSATIRNEMSDLEELGYLNQPHTSAGRVPSVNAYRLYVDELMTQYSLTVEEIEVLRSVMEEKIDYLDKVISKASTVMSDLTNCTSFTVAPRIKTDGIKSIRLIYIESNIFLAVIVTDQGIIKDKKIRLPVKVTADELARLELSINKHLTGLDFSLITVETIIKLVNDANVSNELVLSVFKFVQECINPSSGADVHIDGKTNILNFPEYNDVSKAKKFLQLVDNNQGMLEVVNSMDINEEGVTVSIGAKGTPLEDYSIITSRYKIGDNMEGVIGIIGPTRMDYKKAVSVMKHMTDIVNNKIKEISSGGEDGE